MTTIGIVFRTPIYTKYSKLGIARISITVVLQHSNEEYVELLSSNRGRMPILQLHVARLAIVIHIMWRPNLLLNHY